MIRAAGPFGGQWQYTIVRSMWISGRMPEDSGKREIVPLFRKQGTGENAKPAEDHLV